MTRERRTGRISQSIGAAAVLGAISILVLPSVALAQESAPALDVGWVSLLPPLVAIALALALREVIIALAAGVWLGALVTHSYNPLAASARLVDHYLVDAVADADHASILLFSLALGGMVGVITKSGGASGMAGLVTKHATTPARGQLATWSLGLLIFFDDYANSLLVGSSMRPITDRLRISREKLAFLVDATAAPVSSLALVSSWIGVEIAYIGEQLSERNIELDAYLVFLQTLPYRFYPWLMLAFGLAVVLMGRDFGPMRRAEVRARTTGAVAADASEDNTDEDIERESRELAERDPRPLLALAPIFVVVLVALAGMYSTGLAATEAEGAEPILRNIFGNASSLKALLWAAASGGVVAVALSVGTGAMTMKAALEAWLEGIKSMLLACMILVFAWALGNVCKDLHTAQFVIGAIGDGINPGLLPAAVFVIAAAVSFATGTSWGTMAILFPLVVPLADEMAPGQMHILLGAISSILAGSVFGDHCSPISDTTIMSSMASGCDHVDHVRTQLPYALTVGGIALVVGEIGTGLGIYPAWVGMLLALACVIAVVRFVGTPMGEDKEGFE